MSFQRLFVLLGVLFAVHVAIFAQPAKTEFTKEAAQEAYEAFSQAYLTGDWETVDEQKKQIIRHMRFFTPQQRVDTTYMRKTADDFRPDWWAACSSISETKFPAEIWNRKFIANYKPGRDLGQQGVRAKGRYRQTRDGYKFVPTELIVTVTWRPGLVNDPTPASGDLSQRMGYTLGDIGEVIVWHELGHNYITNALKKEQVIQLYQDYEVLYSHLQEFYADLTAIYHSSPRARRSACQLRLLGLDYYDANEQHDRAAHAIGSLIVTHMMMNPDDWPSVHFPPEVPKKQVELNTIIYVYEHWDANWSVAEAKRLRDLVDNFIDKKGDSTFRRKGRFNLPNRTDFSLMVADDRDNQQERDAWMAKKLAELIESGRADKLAEGETYDPPQRVQRNKGYRSDEAPPRIDIPY